MLDTTTIFPPRPTNAINPVLIPYYEKRDWVAQIKKNGTCNVIRVDESGVADFKTRHGVPNKAWTPTEELKRFFGLLPNCTFVGELLHNKGPSVKNTMYIFDILEMCGDNLIGSTFGERMDILEKMFMTVAFGWVNIIIADVHKKNLSGLFNGLTDPLDEGIVLKNPEGVLEGYNRQDNNQSWQVKCRRPTKNYGS